MACSTLQFHLLQPSLHMSGCKGPFLKLGRPTWWIQHYSSHPGCWLCHVPAGVLPPAGSGGALPEPAQHLKAHADGAALCCALCCSRLLREAVLAPALLSPLGWEQLLCRLERALPSVIPLQMLGGIEDEDDASSRTVGSAPFGMVYLQASEKHSLARYLTFAFNIAPPHQWHANMAADQQHTHPAEIPDISSAECRTAHLSVAPFTAILPCWMAVPDAEYSELLSTSASAPG